MKIVLKKTNTTDYPENIRDLMHVENTEEHVAVIPDSVEQIIPVIVMSRYMVRDTVRYSLPNNEWYTLDPFKPDYDVDEYVLSNSAFMETYEDTIYDKDLCWDGVDVWNKKLYAGLFGDALRNMIRKFTDFLLNRVMKDSEA